MLFVFLCTLDNQYVYFLHLFLHRCQHCRSACVFFFYVYIIISYPKSSFCNVRPGICSYLHSWEEGLKYLNQWERNQTQLSLEKVGCIEAGAGGWYQGWLAIRDAFLRRVRLWTSSGLLLCGGLVGSGRLKAEAFLHSISGQLRTFGPFKVSQKMTGTSLTQGNYTHH